MTLTTIPHDPLLDLDPYVGQRQATFRFARVNGLTGEVLADVTPQRSQQNREASGTFSYGSGARLSHDTTSTIKRRLNLSLGEEDMAAVNVVTDRIDVFMVFPSGVEYPLGRYMFINPSRQVFTSGTLGNMELADEMFLVDQQITTGINGVGSLVIDSIKDTLAGLPIEFTVESSPYLSSDAWGPGTGRGQVLDGLALAGDYLSPWFGNDGKLHFIRGFNPANKVPDLDFDFGNKVARGGILETDDLLTAPNRFVVISNQSTLSTDTPITATFDVPPSAPHSISNRGFVIASVNYLAVTDSVQALGIAKNLSQRNTPLERVGLVTAPDPRHDSYNVIQWQGSKWMELAWDMDLTEGGTMNHILQKTYTS
jgi:hypothetical protein